MKRSLLRLAALSGVVLLGLIAIAQAQRETDSSNPFDRPGASEEAPAPVRPRTPAAAPVVRPRAPGATPVGSAARLPVRPVSNEVEGTSDVPANRPEAKVVMPVRRPLPPPNRLPEDDSEGALPASEPRRYPGAEPARTDEIPASEPAAPRAGGYPGAAAAEAGSLPVSRPGPLENRRSQAGPAPREIPGGPATPSANDPFLPAEDENEPRRPSYGGAPSYGTPGAGRREVPNDLRGGRPQPLEDGEFPAAGGAPTGGVDGVGVPGARELEGQQTPSLSIHKSAPREMQVGQPATLEIVVRNTGSVPAHRVELRDQVPKGTRFLDAQPAARLDPRGELTWALHTLDPAAEAKIKLRVVPLVEGEVGSVATVTFTAEATARSTVTRPQLVVELKGPQKVMINQDVTLSMKISNPGTGPATGVVLRDSIPAGLQHPAGPELEHEIGTLMPGESRELDLTLRAIRAGKVTNILDASGAGDLRAKSVRYDIEVVAPALEVAAAGPKRRYLERQAVYTLSVSNPGTAPAQQVELTAVLPAGFEFVGADNAGRYDPQTRAVHWLLEELPPERSGSVTLTALPTQPGVQELKIEASAQDGLSALGKQEVLVEGVAAVLFQLADVADPIEVGGETAYEIRVMNQGSKTAENVRVTALVPEQMQVLNVEGPTRGVTTGQRIVFEPIPRLAPKADTAFRVKVKGMAAGDLRFRVQLITDEMKSPVTKEESTQIFADE